MDELLQSPLLLSRIQFGFVISFHILFPAFTIGLAHWLAFIEWRWLRTRAQVWRDLYFSGCGSSRSRSAWAWSAASS